MTYTWSATELTKGLPYIKNIPTNVLALLVGAITVGGGIYGGNLPTDLVPIAVSVVSVILTPVLHDKALKPHFTAILEKAIKG
jgi:hypothetical protein